MAELKKDGIRAAMSESVEHETVKGMSQRRLDKAENDAPELQPCPFCGSANLDLSNGYDEDANWVVICNGCKAGGTFCAEKPKAVRKWNTRAEANAWNAVGVVLSGFSRNIRKVDLIEALERERRHTGADLAAPDAAQAAARATEKIVAISSDYASGKRGFYDSEIEEIILAEFAATPDAVRQARPNYYLNAIDIADGVLDKFEERYELSPLMRQHLKGLMLHPISNALEAAALRAEGKGERQ